VVGVPQVTIIKAQQRSRRNKSPDSKVSDSLFLSPALNERLTGSGDADPVVVVVVVVAVFPAAAVLCSGLTAKKTN